MNRRQYRTVFAALCCVFAACSTASAADAPPDPLDCSIARFSVAGLEMTKFSIGFSRSTGVVCGVIIATVPFADDGTPLGHVSTITIDRADVTPRELLDEAIRQAPEYVWRVGAGGTVNILPAREVAAADSFINRPITGFEVNDAPLTSAIRRLTRLAADTDHPLSTFRPSGEVGVAGAEQPIAFSVENGTLLDVLNGAFEAAQRPISWMLHWKLLMCSYVPREAVVTSDLARAEAYLGRPDRTRREAVAQFERAAASAPYAELRAAIELRTAQVLIDPAFPDGAPQPERAARICRGLLDGPLPPLPFYPDIVNAYVEAARACGARDEARAYLSRLLESANRPESLSDEALVFGLLSLDLEADPQASLGALRARRPDYPGNRLYHRMLETSIDWLEFHATTRSQAPAD
ncbi:MAG: hypothetical protein JXR94_22160 [Candidatus Hydrogenedentes bacterium]|nr:hypothetical protein [Candidatus Hydrogenedentota bacterium]